mgnify:CR=1 FL=1
MKMNSGSSLPDMATIIQAEIIENGDALAVLVKERNGTVSAVKIKVGQLAD